MLPVLWKDRTDVVTGACKRGISSVSCVITHSLRSWLLLILCFFHSVFAKASSVTASSQITAKYFLPCSRSTAALTCFQCSSA